MAKRSESPQVDARTVSYTALGIILFLACALLVLALAFPQQISRPTIRAAQFPQPSVRTDERAERLRLEAAQKARLAGADGAIPIARAMALIAARGMKAFDPVEPAP